MIGCASTISVQRLLSTESMLSLKEIVLTPFLLTQVKEYKTSQRSRFCNSDKLKGLTDGRFEVAIEWNTIFLRGNHPTSRMPLQFSLVWIQYRRAGKILDWKMKKLSQALVSEMLFLIRIQQSWICSFPEIFSQYLNIFPQYIVRSSTEIIPLS